MKDSYKCYEKVLIVIVTAIVLCFSVHVRASGVGNKESAQEIVNEYFSLIGNDWDKFAELYTNEQINSFKNFLENEKNIREYVGVLNVRKAKLIESIEIKYDDVKDMIDEDYTGKKIKIFAVGADYDVYEDTKYFSEGIIYTWMDAHEFHGAKSGWLSGNNSTWQTWSESNSDCSRSIDRGRCLQSASDRASTLLRIHSERGRR